MLSSKEKAFFMIKPNNNIDLNEVQKFSDNAQEWWNESGPYHSLHKINITRLSYIQNLLVQHFGLENKTPSLKNLNILDVGCGGGLIAEPLSRLGASVMGIDPSDENISIAKEHASTFGLDILYSPCSLEDLKDQRTYDVVLALEVLEHVPNPEAFVSLCSEKVAPGGIFIIATLNRTLRSYLEGIIAAEYVLKWVPKGTHSWSHFLKPAELYHLLKKSGFQDVSFKGVHFSVLKNEWTLSDTLEVNYMGYATK